MDRHVSRAAVARRAGLAAVLLAGALAPLAFGQETTTRQQRLVFPERTDAGRWHGTWAFASRQDRFAMWMRENDDGVPEVKIRWQDTGTPAGFETDWSTRAEYDTRSSHGTFAIEWEERGQNLLRGTMTWRVEGDGWSRERTGAVRVYRAGVGRAVVLAFDEVSETRRRGDGERSYDYPQVWTFLKASKRLVRWEELPL